MTITLERLTALPLRMRIAWIASIIDKVAGLYSNYFRTRYKLDEALSFAWKFAEGKNALDEEIQDLCDVNVELAEVAEDDGYAASEILMSALLIDEITNDEGGDALAALGHAAIAYGTRVLQEHKVNEMVPIGFVHRVEQPLWDYAEATLSYLEEHATAIPQRNMFSAFSVAHERWSPSDAEAFAGEKVFVAAPSSHEQ